jgi:hypothetical protein
MEGLLAFERFHVGRCLANSQPGARFSEFGVDPLAFEEFNDNAQRGFGDGMHGGGGWKMRESSDRAFLAVVELDCAGAGGGVKDCLGPPAWLASFPRGVFGLAWFPTPNQIAGERSQAAELVLSVDLLLDHVKCEVVESHETPERETQ